MSASFLQDRFAGVVKIFRLNVQFYAGSFLGLLAVALLLASRLLPRWLEAAAIAGAGALAFWTFASLLVSWYVYDHAGVTRWQWLPHKFTKLPRRWANIHAGLDESSVALRQFFPSADGSVIDIYDAAQMTEPSIARARRLYPATEPFLSAKFDSLPLPDEDRDAIFLLFAAHEVRDQRGRTQLLRETRRVLRPGGCVILLEHLRDWKNFAAFGPGFLHFHSGRSWRRSIAQADLNIERAEPITPFACCLVLRKADPCG